MSQTRREFLGQVTSAITLAATATGAAAGPRLSVSAEPGGATAVPGGAGVDPVLATLREIFLAPPDAAKPMTRWWWFGGAVTPAEITRELTLMREAGLRGAEIQPVYPVTADEPGRGIRNLRYHSPEFFAALRHASREARRLGLQLDLTLGSGWPYGGPFVPGSLAARRLRVLSQDVAGPRSFSWDHRSLLVEDDRAAVLALYPIGDDGMLRVEGARILDHRRPAASGGIDIPAGRWCLMLFVDSPTGMLVKRPTLGMEGLVIDHHNRDAIGLFLRAAGDRVFDAVGDGTGGPPPFHSVFCDSLEVYGADWTGRLLQEFEKRRGYDLRPYLPALFSEVGALTPHVRYDYHLTLSDLIIEEFFAPLTEWSRRRGVKARIQAHGAMGDVMRGYGVADIPEGENIFLGDRYQVNLKHRRLASSAAHVYGKALASAETYTWLRTPLYTTTLEMMKAASDSVFLDGINHVVNHGYSYSPPEAGEPGWAFYASTEANHTQTWWRHYPQLARYVQRVSAMLQQGESVNPILVYLPMADVYAGHGAGGLHLDVEVQNRLDPALLDAVRRAGYDFDVVNDHALAESMRVEAGVLKAAGTGRYRVVVVNRAQYMPPESAARIAEFVRAGGHLIVVGPPPEEAPGVKDREARTAALRRTLGELWGGALPASGTGVAPGVSAAIVADVPAAVARLSQVLPPDFRIAATDRPDAAAQVGFTHRRLGEADAYFVANVSADPRDLRVEFAAGHRVPRRWDPVAGREAGSPAYDYVARGAERATAVELRLAPFESCFILFGAEKTRPSLAATDPRGTWEAERTAGTVQVTGLVPAAGAYVLTSSSKAVRRVRAGAVPKVVEVVSNWNLSLGGRPAFPLDRLRPWGELPQGKDFSGWGAYEAQVDIADPGADVEWFVDLGVVHETAHVWLNGRELGAAWYGRRRVGCGDALVRGTNRLKVEVANLWIHHVLAHPPGDPARHLRGVGVDSELAETVGIRWGTYGEVPAKEVPPSGLLGPVRLVPLKRVRLRL